MTGPRKKRTDQPSSIVATAFENHDRRILVLQGGGALGAYQAPYRKY
jgi:hypothetical protein